MQEKPIYKAVSLDLDGTTLTSDHRMPEKSYQVLKALQEKGVHIIISSGRMTQSLLKVCESFDFPFSVNAYNGCKLLEKEENEWETLFEVHLDMESVQAIYEICESENIFLNIYTEENLIAYHAQDRFDWANLYNTQTSSIYTGYHKSLKDLPLQKITKLLCITEPEKREDLYLNFKGLLEKTCHIIKSQPEYVEFTKSGINKATGLKKWCEFHNIAPEQVVSMGDAENDLEMLQLAGKGVAVKNASDGLKRKFPNISVWTNDEFAVFNELSQIFDLDWTGQV